MDEGGDVGSVRDHPVGLEVGVDLKVARLPLDNVLDPEDLADVLEVEELIDILLCVGECVGGWMWV